MTFKEFLIKQILIGFFVSVTLICLAMAALGMIFEPTAATGYKGMLAPPIFGALATLPSLVLYSRSELSLRQMTVRKALQLLLIEAAVLIVVYASGTAVRPVVAASVAASVFIIYIAVHAVQWLIDQRTAMALNAAIMKLQQQEHMQG